MLIVDMTEQTRDELLKDIKEIQSDIWDFKTKDIVELERPQKLGMKLTHNQLICVGAKETYLKNLQE